MTPSSSSFRIASRVRASLLTLVCCLGVSAAARAEVPVTLWGFQRGCERMPDIDRLIEKRLFEQHHTVGLLHSPDGKAPPACAAGQAERCAQSVGSACPGMQGRILGGQAIEGKDIVRTRLWLYDLGTGQIAYQDEYCHTCNLVGALSAQSRQLIENPHFGAAPEATPMYCGGAAARSQSAAKGGPIFVTVYGDGRNKTALSAALQGQLQSLGRAVLPLPIEAKTYSREALERIVSGQQGARVLMADVQREGKVALYMYDQRTTKVDAKTVTCTGCDAEALTTQVKESVSELLDRCSGDECAADVMIGMVTAPIAACEPFPTDSCTSSQLDALLSSGASGAPAAGGAGLDARSAKLLKGLAWGAFAASAATGITLLALSGTSAGQYTNAQGYTYGHNLDGPGWTAIGLSGLLLAVSIPTTLVVNRAAARTRQPVSYSTGPALIQCPTN